MMSFQPVFVKWMDAHSGDTTWHELDDVEPYVVESCGFLVPETEGGKPGHVTVVQSITPDEQMDHVLYIPQGMVQSLQYLAPFTPEKVD